MIAYLPTIYPDELVYRWFCRYWAHSGLLAHSDAMRQLHCRRSDTPSKEFIGHLNADAIARIEKEHSLRDLVLNHTMFPQYARFVSSERRKAALERIGREACDPGHLFPFLPRVPGEEHLRYCPLCVAGDREAYGEAYWHRAHQIRNAAICVRHACRLVESGVSAKSGRDHAFHPAEGCVDTEEAGMETDPEKVAFCRFLVSVFEAPMDLDPDVPVTAIFHEAMSETEYMKAGGRSRHTQRLANDMASFYSDLGTCSVPSIHQIQRAVLGGREEFSVVCQLAFFLGMRPDELTHPQLTPEQIQREQNCHYMRGTQPVDWESMDAELAPRVARLAQDVYTGAANEAGRPERVSEKLVFRKLGLLGHQIGNLPQCQSILAQYAETYPEAWARRIIWAYEKLTTSGSSCFWTDIRKLSGVRRDRALLALPHIEAKTDKNSAIAIQQLIRGKSRQTHEQKLGIRGMAQWRRTTRMLTWGRRMLYMISDHNIRRTP